jgi:lambda family phage portal protein
MSGKYSRTELQAALLNAILAAYIKSPMDHNVLAASLGTSNAIDAVAGYQGLRSDFNEARPILLDGMQIPQFFPGDELVFADAKRPNGAFGEFQRSVLQNVAAATGTSYEQLAQDWSRTNYSSARAALLEAWKFLVARKNHFSDGWLTPIFALWLEDAVDLGEVELPPGSPSFWEGYGFWLQCRWTIGPGRGWVDPTKEAQASQMRMDSGLSTWEDEAADQGRDWEETAEQLAYEQDRRRALGLPNPTSTTVTDPPVDDQDVADDAETRDQDGGDPPRAARPGRSRIPVSGHP